MRKPDEANIKRMISLARFENGTGRKDMEICRYYRRDYVGLRMIGTFFLTTIAFFLLLFLGAAADLDGLTEGILSYNLRAAGSMILIVYIVMLAISLSATYFTASSRWRRAEKNVRDYENGLRHILRDIEGRETK